MGVICSQFKTPYYNFLGVLTVILLPHSSYMRSVLGQYHNIGSLGPIRNDPVVPEPTCKCIMPACPK